MFKIFLVIIGFVFLTQLIYQFSVTLIRHRRSMKKLNQWSDFNNTLMSWGEEIQDNDIKYEFMMYCLDNLTEQHIALRDSDVNSEYINNFDIESEKIKIFNKWGQHIPSLRAEIRNKRINQII